MTLFDPTTYLSNPMNAVGLGADVALPGLGGGLTGGGLSSIIGGGGSATGALGPLGAFGRMAGLGTKAGVADMGLTGARALGYRFLPAAAGLGVDMLADRAIKAVGGNHNSLLSDVGEGAAGGAAAGGVAGVLGGPFAPITVPFGLAVGGAGGALVGGLGHLLFGKKSKPKAAGPSFGREATNVLSDTQNAGLDPDTARNIYDQYGIYLRSQLASARGTDQEGPIRQEAYQKLTSNLMGALQTQQAHQGGIGGALGLGSYRQPSPLDMAASQALTAAYIKPFTDQSIATSKQEQSILSGLANKIGGPTGDALNAQATAASSAGQRTALAYAAQTQLAPQTYAWENQLKQFQSLAAQLQQYALQSYLSGGAGAQGYQPDWSSGAGGGLSAALGGGVLPGTPTLPGQKTTKKK